MIQHLTFAFTGLLTVSVSAFGQTDYCRLKIIRLQFDRNQQVKSGEMTDSLLVLAKMTNEVLLDNTVITRFDIRTDTICCNYAGQVYATSHRYRLPSKSVSQLSSLDIPLCCGIPVALHVDNKEIYRAMLWNMASSFGNKSLTVTLIQNTLLVINQLPNVADYRGNVLTNKSSQPDCLTDNYVAY